MLEDRQEAGERLADKLKKYKNNEDIIVLGIPRGGIPVAAVVSERLSVALGVVLTKKIGAPYQEELAIGAVGPEGTKVLDQELIQTLGVSEDYIMRKVGDLRSEIGKREKKFSNQGTKEPRNERTNVLRNKIIILVDDGVATGATVEVAIKYLRKKKAAKIVLAIPVIPKSNEDKFRELVDEAIFLETPSIFSAVGQFYSNFPQVSDEEVMSKLLGNK